VAPSGCPQATGALVAPSGCSQATGALVAPAGCHFFASDAHKASARKQPSFLNCASGCPQSNRVFLIAL